MRSPQPPLEYLITCSQSSLEGFELARLGQVAQLRAELRSLHEEWIEAEIAARLARFLLEGRRAGAQSVDDARAEPRAMFYESPAAYSAPDSTGERAPVERFSAYLFAPTSSPTSAEFSVPIQSASASADPGNLRDQQESMSLAHSDFSDPLPLHHETAAESAHLNVSRSRAKKGPDRIRRRFDSKRGEGIHSPASHLRNTGLKNSHVLCREAANDASFAAGQARPLRQLLLFQARSDASVSLPSHSDAPSKTNEGSARIFVSGLMLAIPESPKTLKRCSVLYRTKFARR